MPRTRISGTSPNPLASGTPARSKPSAPGNGDDQGSIADISMSGDGQHVRGAGRGKDLRSELRTPGAPADSPVSRAFPGPAGGDDPQPGVTGRHSGLRPRPFHRDPV